MLEASDPECAEPLACHWDVRAKAQRSIDGLAVLPLAVPSSTALTRQNSVFDSSHVTRVNHSGDTRTFLPAHHSWVSTTRERIAQAFHEDILDATDFSVFRLDGMAQNHGRVLEVHFSALSGASQNGGVDLARRCAHRHHTSDGAPGVGRDLLFSERDAKGGRFRSPERHRRDEHTMARKPVVGIHRQVAHGPVSVIEVQITHPSEAAVRRCDGEPLEVVDAA
jgi:hypothetical protein